MSVRTRGRASIVAYGQIEQSVFPVRLTARQRPGLAETVPVSLSMLRSSRTYPCCLDSNKIAFTIVSPFSSGKMSSSYFDGCRAIGVGFGLIIALVSAAARGPLKHRNRYAAQRTGRTRKIPSWGLPSRRFWTKMKRWIGRGFDLRSGAFVFGNQAICARSRSARKQERTRHGLYSRYRKIPL